jgi:carboxyl-terminal processing protease
MNKKISVGVAISLIAIACTVTFVVTWTVSLNMYNEMIPVAKRDDIADKLFEIDTFLQNNFLFLDDIDEDKVAFGIYSGYISGVDDKNTIYMTAEEYANRQSIDSGQIITAGVAVENEEAGYLRVVEVYAESSAETAGILRGDIIKAIDSLDVRDIGQEAAMRLLEGEERTPVTLTVQREGDESIHPLTRLAIALRSVEFARVANIGFIRISTFSEITATQFEEALDSFDSSEIRAIAIDLRGNSSNVYEPVRDMVNHFVSEEGAIAHTEHRGGVRRDFITTDSQTLFEEDIPIVILVDSHTNGAGELMAAILKSFAGAQLVGTNTAGNAYLQQTQELKDLSAIRVTVARILLTCDSQYAVTGIVPTHSVAVEGEVSYDLGLLSMIGDFDEFILDELIDPQLRKAFEIIDTISQ